MKFFPAYLSALTMLVTQIAQGSEPTNTNFIHSRGSAQEKVGVEVDFLVLRLECADLFKSQAEDTVEKILSASADIVCIQKVDAPDACDLYEVLQNTYAHFLYADSFLIASKYAPEDIPFFLREDFTTLQDSELQKMIAPQFTITTTPIIMGNDRLGLLTAVKKKDLYSLDSILKNIESCYWEENCTIICGGKAEASASQDSEGNTSFEASINVSTSSDNGVTYSGGATVEVSVDRDGNVSTEAKVSGGIDW